MKKILINFAHPAKAKSKINMALRNEVEGIEGITVNDLYANYPDFLIDIKREQKLCEEHDVIIFQHPFYWYQAPSILKEWQDLVLEHSWAYGSKGNALKNKLFLQVLTAGGDSSTYHKDGENMYTIEELCSPYIATARLCKMDWILPYSILGIHRGLRKEQRKEHAKKYKEFLEALQKDEVDLDKAKVIDNYSSDLRKVIRRK